MEDEIHLQKFAKLVKAGLNFLSPSEANVSSEVYRKALRMLNFCIISSQVSLVLVIGAHAIVHWDDLSLKAMTGFFVMLLVYTRQCIYLAMLVMKRGKIKILMQTLLEHRKVEDPKQHRLSLRFCKNEITYLKIFYFEAFLAMTSLMFVSVSLNHQLPMDYEIVFLPVEGSARNWAITYFYQLSVTSLGTAFLLFYWPMVLIVMNHSCWMVDSAILHVKKLNFVLSHDDLEIKQVDLRNVIKSLADIIEWQKKAQNLLKFDFLLEFTMLSFVICLAAFTVMANDSDSSYHIFLQLVVSSRLLLCYCLVGSRVDKHLGKLVLSLYELKWESLPAKKQKDIQMMLIMAQKIRKFHGIFESVDLDTFQKILRFSYTLFAVLKTVT